VAPAVLEPEVLGPVVDLAAPSPPYRAVRDPWIVATPSDHHIVMRAEGLEPPRLSPPAPKAGVSTGSTTPARRQPQRAESGDCKVPQTMAEERRSTDTVLEYPNRDKASSKTVKAVVVLLLLVSAALMAVVTAGGWEALQGAKMVGIAYIVLYVILAFFIARWRSGMLPVAAALAIIMGIFAAVSGPEWFARDKEGFTDPALDAELLGMITLVIVPVQLLLIAFAMSGFRQNWQTEVERRVDEDDRRGYDYGDGRGGAVAMPA
jgi:hypothetical protein